MSRTKSPAGKAGRESQASVAETHAKKEPERPVRDKVIDFQGLCSTCWKTDSCTFPQQTQRQVLECDEFRPQEEMALAEKRGKSRAGSSGAGSRDSVIGKYKGLCVNCEARATCALPKPEEGVWRCQEYK